jgi:hypothetical protein
MEVQGDLVFNITPEGAWPMVVNATFGDPASVAITGGFTHTWLNTFNFRTLTLVEDKGGEYFTSSGIRINRMQITTRKTQDRVVTANLNLFGYNQIKSASAVSTGISTAVADALPHFAAVNAAVSKNGSPWAGVQELDITVDKRLQRVDELDGFRGMPHYSTGSETTCRYTVYFSTDAEYKQYFGQSSGASLPYGATMDTVPEDVVITFNGPADNGSGFQNVMVITMYKAVIRRLEMPIQGRDAIMQNIECYPTFDSMAGTDIQIDLSNQMDNAAMIANGVAYGAGTVPANAGSAFTN